ncbi:helix-turn-helix domain-containing protein [Carnobacterium maltaromaticum]|uniref:helix-turn-helix domain-containing protein n=1 Tax=Carnobacterium maltaromaticum TaxID=2751 RepID=UPI0018CD1133|nr:helix-turn-helix domain-containing protein [Carnobacterium maltaromaticum]
MHSLAYHLIVDKVIRRKIDILYAIQNQPRTVTELAQDCNVSVKTILSTVQELLLELPSDLSIELINPSVVYLKVQNFFSFSQYIKSLLNISPLFQVIESIFKGQIINIETFSDTLFISERTLRTYLSTLESFLATYQLSLNKKPLDIVGKESDIRSFYSDYFRYAREKPESQMTEMNALATYKILNPLSKGYGAVLNVDYYHLLSWLQIFEHRISQGHQIILDQEVIEKYSQTKSFHNFKESFFHYFKNNLILKNISTSELIYAFIVRLNSIIYEDDTVFFMEDYLEYVTPFDSITTNFFKKLAIHLTLHVDLRMKIQCFLANLNFLTDITPLFQKGDPELINVVSTHHEEIYNTWISLLKQDTQWQFPEDIAVNLTLITASYLTLNEYKDKKLLIALSGDPVALNYSITIAKKILPEKMNCFFIFNKPITNNLLETLSIDVCIYNFNPLETLTAATLIRLSDTPTEDEWYYNLNKLYTF